jgi:hypothetical protein
MIKECARDIAILWNENRIKGNTSSVYKKYSSKDYMEVAKIVPSSMKNNL